MTVKRITKFRSSVEFYIIGKNRPSILNANKSVTIRAGCRLVSLRNLVIVEEAFICCSALQQ